MGEASKKPKVMCVDDSTAILVKLSMELSKHGFDVITSPTAKSAIETLKNTEVDCIVSDYEMPEISGPEFAKIVKADEKLKLIPFVILTSRAEKEYLLNAIASGADDFQNKSFPVEVIAMKIEAMLRISNLRKEVTNLKWLEGVRQIVVTYNHEFNNPLSIAMGFCEIIRKDLPPEKVENFEKLARQLDRISEIVKKLSKSLKPQETTYIGDTKMIKVS